MGWEFQYIVKNNVEQFNIRIEYISTSKKYFNTGQPYSSLKFEILTAIVTQNKQNQLILLIS